jgi:hypothetical protein
LNEGWAMRARGQKYWNWANADIHVRTHDERLGAGLKINIQVRHCEDVGTQLFIGGYGERGAMLFEEVYDSRPGESMTQAIAWGSARAKELLGSKITVKGPTTKSESLPRKGSRLHKQ